MLLIPPFQESPHNRPSFRFLPEEVTFTRFKVPPSTQSLFPFHLATSHECSTFSFLLTTCPRSLTLISPRFKESPRHTRPFFSTLPRVPTRPPLSFHLSRNLPNLFNLSRRPLSYLFHFTRIPCVLPLHFSP